MLENLKLCTSHLSNIHYDPEKTTEVILKYITADAGVFAIAFSRMTRTFSDFECTDFDLRK